MWEMIALVSVCITVSSIIFIFQVVGNRGTIEINPRDTMAKESSIVGVMLGQASEVRKISNLNSLLDDLHWI